MVMKNILIAISSILMLVNCSNEKQEDEIMNPSNYYISTAVRITLINNKGEDLLRPSTENYFEFDKINLYYLLNGKKVKVQDYDPQIGGDDDKGMVLITETTPYQLACFTYFHGDEGLLSIENGVKTGHSTAYLELNENKTDTIVTEWESKENKHIIVRKIWYNGELFDAENEIVRVIK